MGAGEFRLEAKRCMFDGLFRLLNARPEKGLAVIQGLIERLTELVEEYEGVLDEPRE